MRIEEKWLGTAVTLRLVFARYSFWTSAEVTYIRVCYGFPQYFQACAWIVTWLVHKRILLNPL